MSICIFGASSTWGAWDLEKGGWPNRLRLFIDNNDYDWETYNLGISGDTTREVLERFDVEANSREPKILIFSIGDNDSSYRDSIGDYFVPLEEFGNNILKLISKSKQITDKILFLGIKRVDEEKTTPVEWNKEAYYRNKDIELYDNKLRKTCKDAGVGYVGLKDVIGLNDLSDGLHPNETGHEKIFLKVKEFLIENKWI